MILLVLEEYKTVIVWHVFASLVSAVHETETDCRYWQSTSALIRRILIIFSSGRDDSKPGEAERSCQVLVGWSSTSLQRLEEFARTGCGTAQAALEKRAAGAITNRYLQASRLTIRGQACLPQLQGLSGFNFFRAKSWFSFATTTSYLRLSRCISAAQRRDGVIGRG
jgi:hypothetical protein